MKEKRPKTLVCIANFGVNQNHYLSEVLACYNSWKQPPDVILHSTHHTDVRPFSALKITEHIFPESIGKNLVFEHWKTFHANADNYEFFVYQENDILLTEAVFSNWKSIQSLLPPDRVCGVLRSERDPRGRDYTIDLHPLFPSIQRLEKHSERLFAIPWNRHQGCTLLHKGHLQQLIHSGQMMTPPQRKGYGPLEVGASEAYLCGCLERVIPAEGLQDLLVKHLPNKYVVMTNSFHVIKPYQVQNFASRLKQLSNKSDKYLAQKRVVDQRSNLQRLLFIIFRIKHKIEVLIR